MPFGKRTLGQADDYQSERIHPLDRQPLQQGGGCVAVACGEERANDLAPAHRISANTIGLGIPVNERKGHARTVDSNPGSSAPFARIKHQQSITPMHLRRKAREARQTFIPVHGQDESVGPRKKTYAAHCSIRKRVTKTALLVNAAIRRKSSPRDLRGAHAAGSRRQWRRQTPTA